MASVGITSYGFHVPWFRLNRKTISAALTPLGGGGIPGNKAIANYDEDSLTMAVAAGIDCIRDAPREKIESLLFATTTAPYVEMESATIIANALDLKDNIRTADVTNSLKSGTGALLSGLDTVKAGATNVLVCGADCRLGKPGSPDEMAFGDGGGALLLGSEGVIAAFEGSFSLAYDFFDYRRLGKDKFVRNTEARFIREEGNSKIIPQAVSGLLAKYKLAAKDFAKIAFPTSNQRDYVALAKKMGFEQNQVQEPILNEIGDTGSAAPLMLLAAMLEDAKPGDRLLIASYGNGADALFFKVTDAITQVKDRGRLKRYVGIQQPLSYTRYLIFRSVFPVEVGSPEEQTRTQTPLIWRERKTIIGLYGTRCKKCGTPQFPPQRICANPDCRAIDEMEKYRFADKQATIFSFTEDRGTSTVSPPSIYGMVDFDGGGRFIFDFTDCEAGMVKTGMKVKMGLRLKYVDDVRGFIGYSWKGIPIR